MQRYTIFFIIVDALHVSGGLSANYQELKNCTHSIWYVPGLLLLPLAWLGCSGQPKHVAVYKKRLIYYNLMLQQFYLIIFNNTADVVLVI
jgi:hypothetical protein